MNKLFNPCKRRNKLTSNRKSKELTITSLPEDQEEEKKRKERQKLLCHRKNF
jgi:hypothetical protein